MWNDIKDGIVELVENLVVIASLLAIMVIVMVVFG